MCLNTETHPVVYIQNAVDPNDTMEVYRDCRPASLYPSSPRRMENADGAIGTSAPCFDRNAFMHDRVHRCARGGLGGQEIRPSPHRVGVPPSARWERRGRGDQNIPFQGNVLVRVHRAGAVGGLRPVHHRIFGSMGCRLGRKTPVRGHVGSRVGTSHVVLHGIARDAAFRDPLPYRECRAALR